MNTTFSLERAKNGEPFTYDGRECKFGSISPDGSFHFWVLNTYGWASVSFTQRDLNSIIQYLSMTPKKLEVKIWERDGKVEVRDYELLISWSGFNMVERFMGRKRPYANVESEVVISWDWLMPVVEKINTMEASEFNYDVARMTEFRLRKESLQKLSITTPIDVVRREVVEFAKFYQYERISIFLASREAK